MFYNEIIILTVKRVDGEDGKDIGSATKSFDYRTMLYHKRSVAGQLEDSIEEMKKKLDGGKDEVGK